MDIEKRPLLNQDAKQDVLPNHWTKSEQRLWTFVMICGTAMLYAARTIMPVCITAIAEERHWDKTESGTVLSSFFWGYTVTQFLGGYLSDRVGGEKVLLAASVLWASVTFCTPVLIQLSDDKPTALYIVVLARIILGLCQGVHFPGSTSIISRKVPEDRRSLIFSLIATGANLGIRWPDMGSSDVRVFDTQPDRFRPVFCVSSQSEEKPGFPGLCQTCALGLSVHQSALLVSFGRKLLSEQCILHSSFLDANFLP